MVNRLNRDQILIRALDLLDSSALDAKDRPNGTIVSTALTIGWLQEGLDYFHKKFPFASTVATAPLSIGEGVVTLAQPADLILDYRNGILLANDEGRLQRKSLSYVLNRPIGTVGAPTVYALRGSVIHLWPKPNKPYNATLYYYQLPTVLAAGVVPSFPDDSVLTDYVWLKGREWHKDAAPGSARAYAEQVVRSLQASGLGSEAEEDEIPFDSSFMSKGGPADWMGS
jgi:hypothetical protein